MMKNLVFCFGFLRGQYVEANKLRYRFTELLPMDGIVEGLCAMEVLEAQIACKTVALCFATVNQEFVFVIKPKPTIDTHAIFVVFHIFFIRFAGFQLTQKFKDETFVAIVIATGIATHDTRVRSSSVLRLLLLLFVIVVGSVMKPYRRHHHHSRSRSRSRFFVLRVCCQDNDRKSISILFDHFIIVFEKGPYPQLT